MKIKLFFITLVLLFSSNSLLAQDQLFSKLSDNKNISTIVITKAILSLANNANIGGLDTKNFLNKIDNLEIYTSKNKKASKHMRKEVEKIQKNKAYTTLMIAKDQDKNFSVYGKSSNDETFNDIIVPMEQDSEYTIFRLTGSLTTDDIESILNNVM